MITRTTAVSALRSAAKEAATEVVRAFGRANAWRRPTSGVVLLTAFLVFTLLSVGPLLPVDRALDMELAKDWPDGRPVAETLVMLGQRAVGLPVLFAVTLYAALRRRTWEPVLITVTSVLALNFVVGVIKLATGRNSPRVTEDPSFWEGGILYPSGHTANVILIYGLATYLARHYVGHRRWLSQAMLGLTWFASITVTIGITYLGGHWVTDLVGGLLVGGVVLRVTVSLHRRYLEWCRRRGRPPVPGFLGGRGWRLRADERRPRAR